MFEITPDNTPDIDALRRAAEQAALHRLTEAAADATDHVIISGGSHAQSLENPESDAGLTNAPDTRGRRQPPTPADTEPVPHPDIAPHLFAISGVTVPEDSPSQDPAAPEPPNEADKPPQPSDAIVPPQKPPETSPPIVGDSGEDRPNNNEHNTPGPPHVNVKHFYEKPSPEERKAVLETQDKIVLGVHEKYSEYVAVRVTEHCQTNSVRLERAIPGGKEKTTFTSFYGLTKNGTVPTDITLQTEQAGKPTTGYSYYSNLGIETLRLDTHLAEIHAEMHIESLTSPETATTAQQKVSSRVEAYDLEQALGMNDLPVGPKQMEYLGAVAVASEPLHVPGTRLMQDVLKLKIGQRTVTEGNARDAAIDFTRLVTKNRESGLIVAKDPADGTVMIMHVGKESDDSVENTEQERPFVRIQFSCGPKAFWLSPAMLQTYPDPTNIFTIELHYTLVRGALKASMSHTITTPAGLKTFPGELKWGDAELVYNLRYALRKPIVQSPKPKNR